MAEPPSGCWRQEGASPGLCISWQAFSVWTLGEAQAAVQYFSPFDPMSSKTQGSSWVPPCIAIGHEWLKRTELWLYSRHRPAHRMPAARSIAASCRSLRPPWPCMVLDVPIPSHVTAHGSFRLCLLFRQILLLL